jgi:hypothetical protein
VPGVLRRRGVLKKMKKIRHFTSRDNREKYVYIFKTYTQCVQKEYDVMILSEKVLQINWHTGKVNDFSVST